jgi:phosphinothricin acetyltransferase
MDDALIRPGREADAPGLTDLYNHYVRETPITFDLELFSVEQRRAWLRGFAPAGRHRLLVAERGGSVVGFACSHRFRDKAAYDTSVETTVYLAPGAVGAGLGTRLYAALFAALAGEDVHRALAGVTLPNPASLALHRRFGFEPVGVFHQVGYKFGRYWDVQWLERPLR